MTSSVSNIKGRIFPTHKMVVCVICKFHKTMSKSCKSDFNIFGTDKIKKCFTFGSLQQILSTMKIEQCNSTWYMNYAWHHVIPSSNHSKKKLTHGKHFASHSREGCVWCESHDRMKFMIDWCGRIEFSGRCEVRAACVSQCGIEIVSWTRI